MNACSILILFTMVVLSDARPLCIGATNVLMGLFVCEGSSEYLLLSNEISTKHFEICGSRGLGQRVRPPPRLKNYKAIGFLSNIGRFPWNITRSIKWNFAGGPMMASFKWYLSSKKPSVKLSKLNPPLTKLSRPAHVMLVRLVILLLWIAILGSWFYTCCEF